MKIVDDFWRSLYLYVIASIKFETLYNELEENVAKHVIESGEPNKEMSYRDPLQSQCEGEEKTSKP